MIGALGLLSKSMVLGEPPSVTPFAAFHPHVYPCRVVPAGVAFFGLISPDLILGRRLRAAFFFVCNFNDAYARVWHEPDH
jgi:hypothetical protein